MSDMPKGMDSSGADRLIRRPSSLDSSYEPSGTEMESDSLTINSDTYIMVSQVLGIPLVLLSNSSCRGACGVMNTTEECVCCREITTIIDNIVCITEHPGFNIVCLNLWVLQTACYQ